MSMDEKYPLALPEGSILAGQYVIEKVLGQGGFGITYRATDHKTNQKVAVKEFFPDTLAYREKTTVISYPGERSENYAYGKESFLQEAKTLAEFIGNENIVRIHSYFEENGTAYFVMDYIEGKSFDEYIKEKGGKISVEEAKNILVPVMDALGVVHSKGIVHRDVTPDNIYITSDGTVKLLDFGAARYSLGDKSRSLDVILKHGFAPKEQYTRRGKQGPFTDIYSLGATFYFAITGKRPPDSVERLDEDDLIPPSNLGVSITEYQERAILQALGVQPSERFQSMAEFKKILLNESTVTNQMFFTAPGTDAVPPVYQAPPVVQQVPPTVQQAVQPVQAVQPTPAQPIQTAQSVQPAQKPEITKNKKLIMGLSVAGGVLALVVAFLIGNAFSNKNDVTTSGSGSDNQENASQSSSSYVADNSTTSTPDLSTPDPSTPDPSTPDPATPESATPDPSTPEPATPEPTAYDVNELIVVGTSSANIKNGGMIAENGGKTFYIDENSHALYLAGESEPLDYSAYEGQFSCLSYYNGMLYFVFNGYAMMCDMTQGYNETLTLIPELASYSDIQRLYVTTGCYFVYVDGALCRISRKTGNEEERIYISSPLNIAFSDYGTIFYIYTVEGGQTYLYEIAAYDFTRSFDYYYYIESGTLSEPVVDGDSVYVLRKDSSTMYVEGIHIDSFRSGNLNYTLQMNVSDIVNPNGQNVTFTDVLDLNVSGNNIYFCTNNTDYSCSLYHVINSDNGLDFHRVQGDESRWPNISLGGNDMVYFILYDADNGIYRTYYHAD